MDDTSAELKKKYQEMLMKKSGVERVMMGVDMAESAKRMALSSMYEIESNIERRIHLFLRFYYNDFSKSERTEIIEHLKNKRGK